jgi:hypothetical protein
MRYILLKSIDVSEELVVFIFKVEESNNAQVNYRLIAELTSWF